jgi:hypothetical protein
MKFAIAFLILSAATLRLGAQQEEQAADPNTVFRLALRKIEQDFVNGMRQNAAKAVAVQLYQIGEMRSDWSPFSWAPEGTIFTIQEDGDERAYTVLKAENAIIKKEVIQMWAETVLPEQSHPFAICMPTPGFAIRFLNSSGETIHATTICIKCQSAAVEFPRYSGRIGFDPKAMERLLKEAGFSSDDLKAEAGAGQPATASDSKLDGNQKTQPESEPGPR